MKKILSLLMGIALFVSCSSDDAENSDTLYKVKYGVSGFSIDKNDIVKADAEIPETGGYFQYVVYKQSAKTVVKNRIIAQSLKPVSVFKIEDELAEGDYYVSIMYASANTLSRLPIYTPLNYATDYCIGNQVIVGGSNNENIFYKTFSISVRPDTNADEEVVLVPMWSSIDIKITDAATFKVPEKVSHVFFTISPDYAGFGIADVTASIDKEFLGGGGSFLPMMATTLEKVREEEGHFGNLVTEGADVTIKLQFIEHSEEVNAHVWAEKIIYKGAIEKGYHYTLSGALGDNSSVVDEPSAEAFNVTLRELTEKEVIPF